MERTKYPCPCGGRVRWKKGKVVVEGVDCGVLDVEVCCKCGEEYLPDESLEIVEDKMKAAGLWGVKRKKVSFWKSGSSVVLRIPKEIASELNIESNTRADMYAEGKKRLVVEL